MYKKEFFKSHSNNYCLPRKRCVCVLNHIRLRDFMDCSPPGYSVHEIFQARILEWIAISCSPPGDLPDPGVEPTSPALTGRFFTTAPPGKPSENSSAQSSRSVGSDSLRPHESQHARPPCPSPTPGVHSDSCPSSQ